MLRAFDSLRVPLNTKPLTLTHMHKYAQTKTVTKQTQSLSLDAEAPDSREVLTPDSTTLYLLVFALTTLYMENKGTQTQQYRR